jgi:BirA family biotin operon repressor/biotin-[acetyl-CoA-carboxylase] ligase
MEITEIHFDRIDSTSAFSKREFASFDPGKITIVSADEQTAGYGRYQRKWICPKGVNLYVTFCFKLPLNVPDIGSLAMVAAYSVAKLLIEAGLHPHIKWPNDVQLSGKKVSGALVETIVEAESIQIFVGIGLNVNMSKADLAQVDQPATSLKEETGQTQDRKALLKKLAAQFAHDLELFKRKGFAPFHQKVEAILSNKGKKVSCFDGKKSWEGVLHSLGKDGRLILLLDSGELHALLSGDLSAS